MFHSEHTWAGGVRYVKFSIEVDREHEYKAVHIRCQYNSYRLYFYFFYRKWYLSDCGVVLWATR